MSLHRGNQPGRIADAARSRRFALSAAYTKDAGHYQMFEPFAVLGYPAVAEAENTTEKGCTVVVGTAQNQGIELTKYPDQNAGDLATVCAQLKTVAMAAIRNLG